MTHNLVTRLLNYFLLIAIAAIMIGVEFFFEMQRDDLTQEICSFSQHQIVSTTEPSKTDHSESPLMQLRNKIVIMFGVLTVVVAIVMTMFIKNITIPLQKMSDAAKAINEGDLSRVIHIDSKDEIGMVGQAINELTSNLQEVASFSCVTANQTLDKVNLLADKLKINTSFEMSDIEDIRASLNALVEFSDSFQLLHTDIKNVS
ncbi:MAG: HAMP domain-containing protein [Gammaproteobacteria bacterium]|nr:HAMP domain-containing protein [Gammaproteobacteria bacterium]